MEQNQEQGQEQEQCLSKTRQMSQNQEQQWIIFRKDGYDTSPLNCISELAYDDNEHCIIHKKIDQRIGGNIDIYVTYKNNNGQWEFLRGFLYKRNNEYKITSFLVLSSLQIGAFCYDRIAICEYS